MTLVSFGGRACNVRINLRRLLKREWLSQREAASRIGVSYKWFRRLCHQGLERTDRRTAADVRKVSAFFGVQVSDLWHDDIAASFGSGEGQPLIKWTGSKRRQAAEIVERFPPRIGTYYEPFVGGGSVLYRLLGSGIPVERYRCSDSCRPLIGLWQLLKNDPRRVIDVYEDLWSCLRESGSTAYYSIRDEFNDSGDPTLFYFLLRTCRNGLVRFNDSGDFTSAYHHGRVGMKPSHVKSVVSDWATKLRDHDVRFYVRDYLRIEADEGDLLYLDPPYAIDNGTRLYSGPIDFGEFFKWLRRQQGNYLLSLNGFSDDEDNTVAVPRDLFDEHALIDAGQSSFKRLNGGTTTANRDSLYMRVPQSQSIIRDAIKQSEEPAETFRNNIRKLLESHSMSQREAADCFDIAYKSMRRFCHLGLQRPDKRTRAGLERLARHFGLTLADLWTLSSHQQASPPDTENILGNLHRYCGDQFIDIPKQHWCVLADEAARTDESKQQIAERLALVVGQFDPPCPPVSDERRRNDFKLFMARSDDRERVDLTFDDLSVSPAAQWSRLGCRFLNSSFLENRISGGHRSSPSLIEAWADKDRRTSIMRAALTLKKHLNEVTAYEAAAIKIHIPANFRPTAARAICDDFGNGGTVLDFSAGYGGRFLGFLGSTCRHYIGIDPNISLRPAFDDMFSWLGNNHKHDKSWQMVWEPAEDVDYSSWQGKVDLIFTSPPYFDLEQYTRQPTQSSARYKNLDAWLNEFLFKTLRGATDCLKADGRLVLNVADSPSNGVKIVEPLIEHVTRTLRFKLLTVVPMLLSSKPGADRSRVGWGKKAEPILVFSKSV